MNFDTLFIFILALAFFYGFIRGFLRQLLSLVGLLAAFYAALNYPQRALNLLAPHIKNPSLLKIAAAVLTFIAVYLVFALASAVISFLIKGAIGLADRLLGGAFAAVKAVIFLMALAMLLVSFEGTRNFVLKSRTGPYMVSLASKLFAKGKNFLEEKWNSAENWKRK